jgi:hypothetical protein
MATQRTTLMLTIGVLLLMLVGIVTAQEDTGTLDFVANGEDFVREGFVAKDGWRIDFDHVFIVLDDIRAYQTNPPYDPFAGELTRAQLMVGLADTRILDLAEGDADATPILVDNIADAPAGYYNAVAWRVVPAEEGELAGVSLQMVGTASYEGETVDFTISMGESLVFQCGAFVGDERKGVLPAGAMGEVEMTFHFDHIFGDAEAPLDDSLNMGALGFAPFAELSSDGMLNVTLADLEAGWSAATYAMLVNVLPSLGHVGEGHCHEG